jgi:hypothetical protein
MMSNVCEVDVSLGRGCLPCRCCTPGLAWRHARCIQHIQCLFAVLHKLLHKTEKKGTDRVIMRSLLQHVVKCIPCNLTYTDMKLLFIFADVNVFLKKEIRIFITPFVPVGCPGPLHKTFRYNFLKTALFSVHRMLF